MKCFTHRSADAIGVCRACQKGLCAECAVDQKFALSCRGDCESEVEFARSQNLASRKIIAAQKRNKYLAPGFFGAFGIIFLYQDLREGRISWFATGLGSMFILFALALFMANRKWTKDDKSDEV